MADQKEKVLAKGVYVEKPSTNAPDWVIAKISFKMSEAVAFLQENENNAGYVNLDVLMSKDGSKYYAALNQFEPKKLESLEDRGEPDTNDASQFPAEGSDEIPF